MEKLNRLISQSISFWSFPNGNGASHLIFQQEFPYSPCKWHWNPRFCFYPSLRTEIVFQDIEKENQYSPKMFFFLNENILQRMIAPSVAQQSSFTWMHLYLSHFTCSDLGGLWLPSRKKTKLLIRVILSDITWYSVALMSSYLFWSEEVQSCRFRTITQQRTSINSFSQLRISF